MGNLWLKIKIWTKIIFFGLVVIYALLFIWNNQGSVEIWIWPNHKPQTFVLLLVLYSFLGGIVLAILVRTTFTTLRQIRELKTRGRTERLEREMADLRMKAGMLREKAPTALADPAAEPLPTDPPAVE